MQSSPRFSSLRGGPTKSDSILWAGNCVDLRSSIEYLRRRFVSAVSSAFNVPQTIPELWSRISERAQNVDKDILMYVREERMCECLKLEMQDIPIVCRTCPCLEQAIEVSKHNEHFPGFVFRQKGSCCTSAVTELQLLLVLRGVSLDDSQEMLHSAPCSFEKRHSYCHSLCAVALHYVTVALFFHAFGCYTIAFP